MTSVENNFKLFSDDELKWLFKAIAAYGEAVNQFGVKTGDGTVPMKLLDDAAAEMQARGIMKKVLP